jgi:hypothetical protein
LRNSGGIRADVFRLDEDAHSYSIINPTLSERRVTLVKVKTNIKAGAGGAYPSG